MTHDDSDHYDDSEKKDHEGLYDAQLSLPLPFVEAPEPFTTVLKRNGREESFDRNKIANAIFQAAHSIGGTDQDLAQSLARAVTIYLTKQLGGHVPTVDHIHDAVERVLIQMTHIRTAFAYARYRDRRARIRRLREGDMRLLLGELQEARSDEGEPMHGRNLFVRTSEDSLLSWNRDRIVEALVRETGLDESMATVVATEVEQQLDSAHIENLTTSLVRELVAARLVAHGLSEYRDRHRRLGVPLYDCERIVRGLTDATVGRDPIATDRVLAGAVKKEYALTQIHAPHVSDAHLTGAIHLHDLSQPDRLHQVTLSPGMLAAFGVGIPSAPDFASPPRNAATFLAQMAKATASFQACVSGPLQWDAVNYHFAAYVRDLSPEELGQFAQMMVYEFAYRALAHGGDGEGTELRFYWSAPAHLADAKVVGPEDVVPDCTYRELEHAAQQLAWKFLDVLAACRGLPVIAPQVGICLSPDFFQQPGSEAFLAKAATMVEEGWPVSFYFRPENPAGDYLPWEPLRAVFHNVSLNLPRIAYASGKETAFLEALDKRLGIVFRGLSERYEFLEGLMDRGAAGPLALLSLKGSEGPVFDMAKMRGYVSVCGLDESVKCLFGVQMHESPEARSLGARIMDRILRQAELEQKRQRIDVRIAGESRAHVRQRFAETDLTKYPKTSKTTINTQEGRAMIGYTSGVALHYDRGLSPFEALQYEGEFHGSMEGDHIATVSLPDTGMTGETIATFLRKAFEHSHINGIRFTISD